MILLQTFRAPVIGVEPVPWSTIIAGVVGIVVVLVGMFQLWYTRRLADKDKQIAEAAATRAEQQRLEKQVVAPILTAAIGIDKATQVIYLGHDSTDTSPIINAFQEYGISNRIMVKLTTESVMEYLSDHPGVTMCIIANVVDAPMGDVFLTAVKGNKLTMSIPIIAIDSFSDTERVRLFEAGVDGFLKHPFAVSALMLIMTRLGFSSTFAKTK